MKVIATACKGSDLKPGELFSTEGPLYWENFDPFSIGQRVYIRTNAPQWFADDGHETVYRITIEHELPDDAETHHWRGYGYGDNK